MAERQETTESTGANESAEGVLGQTLSPRARQQESLDDTLHLINRVVAAAATSIVVSDPHQPDNPIVFHNPAFEAITGYAHAEIDGHNCRFLQGPDTDPETVAALRQTIAEGRSGEFLLRNYRRDGTPFWNHLSLSAIHDSDGRLTHFVGVQNDVTRRADAERERDTLLAQQTRIVETLQRALLLTPVQPELIGVEVATRYEAAWDEAQFGGDFFDTFALSDTRVALVVGDCSGKGLAAAQYTAEAKYALRVLLREYGGHPGPALHRLNTFLTQAQRWDSRDSGALVCVAVAVVDTQTGEASLVTAGMEPPLVLRVRTGAIETIDTSGQILGMDPDAEYRTETVLLDDGDLLLLTTDGVTEARGPRPKRAFFGYEGLMDATRRAVARTADLGQISTQIVAEAQAFADGRPQDDIGLLIARRRPIIPVTPARLVGAAETLPPLSATVAAAVMTTGSSDSALAALEIAGIGYWEMDVARGTALRSRRHDQIFGYDTLLPAWDYEQFLRHVHPDDRARVDAQYGRALATGGAWDFTCRIVRANDNALRWIEVRGRPLTDAQTTIRLVGTVVDVTDRERAEAAWQDADTERTRLVAQLQEANARQRRFLREMLFGFTEGRLRLCDTEADLPPALPDALIDGLIVGPVDLAPPTLRVLRRHVSRVARSLDLPEERVLDLETATGEAAMNAVRHAGGGQARVCADPETGVVQVWIRDRGAGITEELIHRALERGWTTGGFGQGFFLIRSCADRVYLLTGPTGTTLVLEQERIAPEPPWLKGPLGG